MLTHHELEDIKELYIDNLDLAPKTIYNYKASIERFIEFCKEQNIESPTSTTIIKYKRSLKGDKLAARTIYKHISALKNLYRWLRLFHREFGLDPKYAGDISERVKNVPPVYTFAKEPLSIPEAKSLLKLCEERAENLLGLRNYAIILLMLTTGVRLIEVSRALKKDYRKYRGTVVLYVHGKGRVTKEEFVKLPRKVQEVLNLYLFLRSDDNPFLFIRDHQKNHNHQLSPNSISHMIREYLRTLNLHSSKVTAHSLRHTCATVNLESGGSLLATQQLLRHSDLKTTLIYAHNIGRIKDDSVERIAHTLLK